MDRLNISYRAIGEAVLRLRIRCIIYGLIEKNHIVMQIKKDLSSV